MQIIYGPKLLNYFFFSCCTLWNSCCATAYKAVFAFLLPKHSWLGALSWVKHIEHSTALHLLQLSSPSDGQGALCTGSNAMAPCLMADRTPLVRAVLLMVPSSVEGSWWRIFPFSISFWRLCISSQTFQNWLPAGRLLQMQCGEQTRGFPKAAFTVTISVLCMMDTSILLPRGWREGIITKIELFFLLLWIESIFLKHPVLIFILNAVNTQVQKVLDLGNELKWL